MSQTNWHVLSLFQGENFFKKTSLFGIFTFGVVRKLLIWHNFFLFLLGESSDFNADVCKLGGSVLPHPVRCPVNRQKVISHYCNRNSLRSTGRMREFLEIYVSEMQDSREDGSLY